VSLSLHVWPSNHRICTHDCSEHPIAHTKTELYCEHTNCRGTTCPGVNAGAWTDTLQVPVSLGGCSQATLSFKVRCVYTCTRRTHAHAHACTSEPG
jgi:hypothetical protein